MKKLFSLGLMVLTMISLHAGHNKKIHPLVIHHQEFVDWCLEIFGVNIQDAVQEMIVTQSKNPIRFLTAHMHEVEEGFGSDCVSIVDGGPSAVYDNLFDHLKIKAVNIDSENREFNANQALNPEFKSYSYTMKIKNSSDSVVWTNAVMEGLYRVLEKYAKDCLSHPLAKDVTRSLASEQVFYFSIAYDPQSKVIRVEYLPWEYYRLDDACDDQKSKNEGVSFDDYLIVPSVVLSFLGGALFLKAVGDCFIGEAMEAE